VTRTAVEVAILVLLALGALGGMWLGWRRRAVRWAAVGLDLPPVPADLAPVHGPVVATYVATTPADAPLERVATERLGVRAAAEVTVAAEGMLLRRAGAVDLYLPADRLVEVTVADGIAGTALGRGRLVLVRWRAAGRVLQTGVLPRHDADRAPLTEALQRLTQTEEDPR